MADSDIQTAVETAAQAPKRIRGDEGEVEAHSLKEQIEVDKYIESKRARGNGLGLKMARFKPPGAV